MARMTLTRPLERTVALVSAVAPAWLAQLALRLAVAVPFWRSGVLKWDGFL
jgi:putative oxidoreductase